MFHLLIRLSKLFKLRRVQIDGNVFRLHTGVTVAFSWLSACFSPPRSTCSRPSTATCSTIESLPNGIVDSFCGIESTYNLRSLFKASCNGSVVHSETGPGSGERKYHTYYQWVCFPMFAQAAASTRPSGCGRPGKMARYPPLSPPLTFAPPSRRIAVIAARGWSTSS